ncbi:carboxylesterase/lipase family protein [Nocardia sp. NPDC088792]|uniref:carboxylesterase/lipase family protein n=1 Tax=Nocardia sp. NPDC088792 TaxID=3364332 RepID=UPI00382AF765
MVHRLICSSLMLVLVALGAPGIATAQPGIGDIVTVDTGALRGADHDGYRQFEGIPYAAPPVGALRWQSPQPAASWTGVRAATSPGSNCPQGKDQGNEDCLYLNVATPATAPADGKLPVLVWIHGGSFTSGNGAMYGPGKFMTRGDGPMIVVTINYRLGALGFLAHPALATASGDAGNYGLMDQQAALQWVQRNISAFGGDPGKVTVAGESAGAISVCAQLAAPGSAGLFRGAIMESGPCAAGQTRDDAEQTGENFARQVGCADPATAAQCLRALPVSSLLAGSADRVSGAAGGWNSTSETPFMPLSPQDALKQGKTNPVPVINGNNHTEMSLWVYKDYGIPLVSKTLTAQDYPAVVAKYVNSKFANGLTPDQVDEIVSHYPASAYPQPAVALSTAWTDQLVGGIGAEDALFAVRNQVYGYQFDDPSPVGPPSTFPLGAFHASELPSLWDLKGVSPIADQVMTPDQKTLSDQMVRYWSRFVVAGTPDPAGLTAFPAYGPDHRIMSLRPTGSVVIDSFDAEHQCDFWKAVAPSPF